MSNLLKITFYLFFSVLLSSFVHKPKKIEIDVIDVLVKQKYECRPNAEFMFYVETEIVKKMRGANIINASIYVLNRTTSKSTLLASENIFCVNYKDAVFLEQNVFKKDNESFVLGNGDRAIRSYKNTPYCFNQLIKFHTIFNSYTQSRNNLLNNQKL